MVAFTSLYAKGRTVKERIEINPRVCGGKPVIKGTRIPVSIILEQLAEGVDWPSLLKNYPEISRQDIRAALHYARNFIEFTDFTPLKPA